MAKDAYRYVGTISSANFRPSGREKRFDSIETASGRKPKPQQLRDVLAHKEQRIDLAQIASAIIASIRSVGLDVLS
jgi:hypothetical protein